MDLKPGTIVANRYEVVSPIKKGGMGAVYRARDNHFRGREIALKVMLDDTSAGANMELFKRKFEEEANILVNLSHSQIPRVHDHFVFAGCHFIIMDLIEGESLELLLEEYQVLAGNPVPEKLVVNYAIQILGILEYLHGQEPKPLIHRDIKPGNIILRKMKTEVVLVDFGLARTVTPSALTMNTSVGTVGYAPLEQYNGQAEPRSDIYSLGVTMHHLISGKPPIPLRIPPLEQVIPGVNRQLADIVNQAVEDSPEDRFQSATDMKKALQEVLAFMEGEVVPIQPTPEQTLQLSRNLYRETATPSWNPEEQARETAQGTPSIIEHAPVQQIAPIPGAVSPHEVSSPKSAQTILGEIPTEVMGDTPEVHQVTINIPVQKVKNLATNKNVRAVAIAVLVFSLLLFLFFRYKTGEVYSFFLNNSEVKENYQLVWQKGVKFQDGKAVFEVTGNNDRAGILFKRRDGAKRHIPGYIQFETTGWEGNPDILVFTGSYGMMVYDDASGENRYRLSIKQINSEPDSDPNWLANLIFLDVSGMAEIPHENPEGNEGSEPGKNIISVFSFNLPAFYENEKDQGFKAIANNLTIPGAEFKFTSSRLPMKDADLLGFVVLHQNSAMTQNARVKIFNVHVAYPK